MLAILQKDPDLSPYEAHLNARHTRYREKKARLLKDAATLSDFANGHLYFGLTKTENGICYREWAPGAESAFVMGDFNGWNPKSHPMKKIGNGIFEITLSPSPDPGSFLKVRFERGKESWERIPLYAKRVVQDPETRLWAAEVPDFRPFPWKCKTFHPKKDLLIYECHVGMAQEEGKVGSYREFTQKVLPRIRKAGYTAIQLMAVMEHPYYGSFGYQVSNFFAASSRFGTCDELKELIDTAHQMGIAVLLDVVHSHAVKNTEEGIFRFDGTDHQFFHLGERGHHPAWDTKLFDYGKNEVLHFLLSNLKFWLTEYRFDGFRFDGVTSMLYRDHGLGRDFCDYSQYFTENTDPDALTYLQLANDLIREVSPNAISICEEMSGMPGMCLPIEEGGVGFDFRLAMGVPDLWIRLLKEVPDEKWSVGHLWFELTRRRAGEKNVGYAESHDQALVGDQTIFFRLCDRELYDHMSKKTESVVIDRGMALHKMIRLLTLTLGGEGYLNFMGNEFGHPEWIDFPREGNNWSYHYCRRQWHLADDENLRYHQLLDFDRAMLALVKKHKILSGKAKLLLCHEEDQVLVFEKKGAIFAFNFNPEKSFEGYLIPTGKRVFFRPRLSTDEGAFGGWDRLDLSYCYTAEKQKDGQVGFPIYLPSRTAVCLGSVKK